MFEIQTQPVVDHRHLISVHGCVFQDDHVPERLIAANVAPVKVTTKHRRRGIIVVPPRTVGQQERRDPLVEQDLVVELIIVVVKFPHLGRRMLILEHESMAMALAVAVVDDSYTVYHGRRELVLFGVQPLHFERHDPATRPERFCRGHILYRSIHLRHHRVRPRLTIGLDVVVVSRVVPCVVEMALNRPRAGMRIVEVGTDESQLDIASLNNRINVELQ